MIDVVMLFRKIVYFMYRRSVNTLYGQNTELLNVNYVDILSLKINCLYGIPVHMSFLSVLFNVAKIVWCWWNEREWISMEDLWNDVDRVKTEVLWDKALPLPPCSQKIPHGLAMDQTQASAVRGHGMCPLTEFNLKSCNMNFLLDLSVNFI
jgi:hypothetical protein